MPGWRLLRLECQAGTGCGLMGSRSVCMNVKHRPGL